MSNNDNSKIITILLVSDIHLSFSNINKIGQYIKKENKKIDLVLCPGDVCNFDPIESENLDKVRECEAEMKEIYKSLESIVEPTTNIIYLPGNHDAKTTLLFNENNDNHLIAPKLTDRSHNIHKSNYRLDDDLVLVGLGGSLPSYCDDKPYWTGYPYDNKDNKGEENVLNDLKFSMSNENIKQTDKIILFTHMGPYNSSTTIDQIDLNISPIYSGSKSIETIIKENQNSIFLNIHGHTHESTGLARVGKTYILNPGSSRAGRYVILTLEKYCGQLWRSKSTEFFKL